MPAAISLVLIFTFVLPSFVIFEPHESGETIGFKLIIVISVASSGIVAALFRMFGSWWRTRRLIAAWVRDSIQIELDHVVVPAYKLQHIFPVFAIVGVFRPRLFIAEQVLQTLDPDEVAAVVKHELGHMAAFDNLKRLAMRLCSDLLVAPIGGSLDRNWSETTEKAADDYAVEHGSRSTALSLASALVKIARLVPNKPLPPMPAVSYALQADDSLAVRVRRLLNLAGRENVSARRTHRSLLPVSILVVVAMAVLATDARLLESVHYVSERILAALE